MNSTDFENTFVNCETYQTTPSKYGPGTFYFTDCGNRMYSIRDMYAYDKKKCPQCGKTLLLRGTTEGIEYTNWKLNSRVYV